MKLEGLWRVQEMLSFNEDGPFWRPAQEFLHDETLDDDLRSMASWKFLFGADGMLKVLAPLPAQVPQEAIDQAAAAGEIRLFDSRTIIAEEHPWKEETGKYYCDSGIEGEVLGEPVSPWMEIIETDGMIEWMSCRLVRAEE